MASHLPLMKTFLFVVSLSVLLPQPSVKSQEIITNHHQLHGLGIDKISRALSDKGYIAMSIILQGALSSLIPFETTRNDSTTFTILCPPDKAFFTPKYPQPPLTLLQYHIVPSSLNRESLESPLKYQSKIDTLLRGHPLVLTSSPHYHRASINDVEITEWDLYNDGRVIVHGVDDFFDPAFQTLYYPWYDSNNGDSKINNKGVEKSVSSSLGYSTSWVRHMTMENLFFILVLVVTAGVALSLAWFYGGNRRYSEYDYVY